MNENFFPLMAMSPEPRIKQMFSEYLANFVSLGGSASKLLHFPPNSNGSLIEILVKIRIGELLKPASARGEEGAPSDPPSLFPLAEELLRHCEATSAACFSSEMAERLLRIVLTGDGIQYGWMTSFAPRGSSGITDGLGFKQRALRWVLDRWIAGSSSVRLVRETFREWLQTPLLLPAEDGKKLDMNILGLDPLLVDQAEAVLDSSDKSFSPLLSFVQSRGLVDDAESRKTEVYEALTYYADTSYSPPLEEDRAYELVFPILWAVVLAVVTDRPSMNFSISSSVSPLN